MVDKRIDSHAWAMLMYEQGDAQEGLQSLFKGIADNPEYGEEEFAVDMAHVYMHLNRAWNSRNAPAEQQDDSALRNRWANFPLDLIPLSAS